jgi:hypothetical protein
MKVDVRKYTKGTLNQEELKERNAKNIQKILNAIRAKDDFKSAWNISEEPNLKKKLPRYSTTFENLHAAANSDSEGSRGFHFDQLFKEHKELYRLMYALQIDNYLIYYVPATGSKRVQRLGGKEEGKTGSPSSQLYLNIHLLSNADEYVQFVVSPKLSLDKILRYICNKPYWEPEESKNKKGIFGSFGRQGRDLKNQPRFVEQTAEFRPSLAKLLSLLGLTSPADSKAEGSKVKELTSADLSEISFAKKVINEIDSSSSYAGVVVSSTTTVAQSFTPQELRAGTSQETPMRLYVYLCAKDTNELESAQTQKDPPSHTVFIADEMINLFKTYLSLPSKDKESSAEDDQTKKIVAEMIDAVFSALFDIVPYSSSPRFNAADYFSTSDKGQHQLAVNNPLVITKNEQQRTRKNSN